MIVGTAGHIDHGKTALVHALTGVNTDRLKEEKARGISIDLGFAYLPTADGTVIGFVDVPGHERFIRNMLAGATGVDFALLVVAADDGVMPQTREHVAILDLLGIVKGIVALTKVDLVSGERAAEVRQDISALLSSTGLAQAEILPVSTVTGEGIAGLREMLMAAARGHAARAASGRFRMAVDRCFTLTGIGTVVTGTVSSGMVDVGDTVTISPSGLVARVRSLHAQNRPSARGQAGDRCALNLAGEGITKSAIARGDVALASELHAPTDRIDAALRVLATEGRPIWHWVPVHLHHGAAEVGARIALLEDAPIGPGQGGRVQLVLDRPIAAAVGDPFIVRDAAAQRTIGGGRFVDLRGPSRRRRTPTRLAQLDAAAHADPQQALAALAECWPFHVALDAFARDRALAVADVHTMAKSCGLVSVRSHDTEVAFLAAAWRRLAVDLQAALARFHVANPDLAGITPDRLRLQIEPRLPAPLFASVLQDLSRQNNIRLDGAVVRFAGHEARLTDADALLWARIKPLLSGDERFRPPRGGEIAGLAHAPETEVRRLLKSLGRRNIVVEIAPDHFFLHETVGEMVEIAADLAQKSPDRQFGAAAFRDRLDNGRKVAIQILEFFDRHGVTLRRGDLRRMNTQRLHRFARRDGGEVAPVTATDGRDASPVGRPDFKSGKGREPVLGGFDSRSLPPRSSGGR
jgi:selenocysteine-specific elongation factor